MTRTHLVYGDLITTDHPSISINDLAVTRGFAVFEFFRTYQGRRPFMVRRHVGRLIESAAGIGLPLTMSTEEILGAIQKTILANEGTDELALRVLVTGGDSKGFVSNSDAKLSIIVDAAFDFPVELYELGTSVVTHEYIRPNPIFKTTNYIEACKLMPYALAKGATEVIYLHEDTVLEGSHSSLFVVQDECVCTQKESVLNGVTRHIVLHHLNSGLEHKEVNLQRASLANSDEIFLSVTGKGIVPVVTVDDAYVGDGNPGLVTQRLISQFQSFIGSTKWHSL